MSNVKFSWDIFIRIYGMVYIDFYIKVIPPVVLFCLPFERRKHFLLRAVFSVPFLLIYSALCCGASLFFLNKINSILFTFLQNIILFLGAYLIMISFYRASHSTLLFHLLGSYALHEIAMLLFYIIYTIIPWLYVSRTDSITYYFFLLLWYCLDYTVFYFFLIRKQNLNYSPSMDSNHAELYFSLGITLFLIIFYLNRRSYVEPHSIMDYLCILVLLLFYTEILLLMNGQLRLMQTSKETMLAKKVWEEKEKSLRMAQEAVNTVNIKYHDMKHMISFLKEGKDTNLLAAELEDSIQEFEHIISTGNDTLDVILAEHYMMFSKNYVVFSCIADGKALSFMRSTDVISLFSNALDNALEANLLLPANERFVHLTVTNALGLVSIVSENPMKDSDSTVMLNGIPVTTKEDKSFHGFGTKSIKAVAGKYSGYASFTAEDHVFTLRVVIPMK